ncbi:hypothetical protein D3C87_1579010 [compost metagenome]
MGVVGDQAGGLGLAGLHADGVGAGADQGHLAAQDVQQLRQFIQAADPQEAADTGDAVVVGCDLTGGGGVGGLVTHGAELPHDDLFLVEAVAALAEQGRTGAVEAHQASDQQQRRRQKQQADRGQNDVLKAFVKSATVRRHSAMHQGQRRLRQTFERRVALLRRPGIDQQGQGNR